MKSSILKILFFTLSPIFVLAQLNVASGPTGCDDVNTSALICSLEELDGSIGSLENTIPDSPPCPLGTDCGVGTSCDNNIWFSFLANGPTLDITIIPSNCDQGTSPGFPFGIQGQVFQISDCSTPSGFTGVSNCFSIGGTDPNLDPFTLNCAGLIPGGIYTVMLDGWGGSICDFEIDINDISPSPPPVLSDISGPTEVCAGELIQYCVDYIPSFTFVENYTFTTNGIGSIVGTTYFLNSPPSKVCIDMIANGDTSGNIEVFGYNECVESNVSMLQITSTNIDIPTQFDTICIQVGESITWESNLIDTPGTYTANYQNFNGCDSTLFLTVYQEPISEFSFTISDLDVDFMNMSQNGDSYLWDFGDGNISDLDNPSHSYSEPGTYTVSLTTTSIQCESVTTTQEITVLIPPTPNFQFIAVGDCIPLIVQFEDLSEGEVESYFWTFEGGIPASSTEQHPTVVYNEIGSYDIELSVTNAAGTSTVLINDTIEVQALPIAEFDFADQGNNTFQFYNLSQYEDNYEWDFGDGNNSTEASPEHTYADAGSYTVVLSVSNDCSTSVFTQEIIITSTNTLAFSNYILVYPNPNTGIFTIDWSESKETITGIRLYNTLGQVIRKYSIELETHLQIDLQDSASGIYYAELQSEKGLIIKRVIKG